MIVSKSRISDAESPRRIFGTFLLDEDEYAIEMADLREVVEAPDLLQKMPLAPDYLRGLFRLRGMILPVIDLRMLLGSKATRSVDAPRQRLAILQQGAACIGVLFDAVVGVLRATAEELSPVAYGNTGSGPAVPVKAVICRVGIDRMIQVLDLGALFSIRNLPAIAQSNSHGGPEHHMAHRMRDLYREKLIGFSVGDCAMALEMKSIVSIVRSSQKRPGPRKTEFCDSVVTVHGRVVPVVKARDLLKLGTPSEGANILVCQIEDRWIGFEVDSVTSIIPYSRDRVVPIPLLQDFKAAVFHGCFTDPTGKDFIVLNEQGMLSRAEVNEVSLGHERLAARDAVAVTAKASPRTSILTFRIGRLYGLRLLDVLEVLSWQDCLVRTPDTPVAVLGVLNLRGMPIPIVDPRILFNIEPQTGDLSSNVLVFQDGDRKVAMRVDAVESILSISTGEEQDLPELFFETEKTQFDSGFGRAINTDTGSGKNVVVILKSKQIVERLSSALAA